MRIISGGTIVALAVVLTACGGSSSSGGTPAPAAAPPPAPPPTGITKPEAFRFLNQATMGATQADADRVIAIGYEAWIDEQLVRPASLSLPHVQSITPPLPNIQDLHRDRLDVWFRNAVNGPDQLRQRVGFALSEIMVVSQAGALGNYPYAVASYQDLLVTQGLGNFRDLIEAITLHPAMGVYLSMLGNQRPDPVRNIRPDENYARELMQLFTLGLVELNLDGTPRLDGTGQPIPTYSQPIIEGFAHVYTGWTYANARNGNFLAAFPQAANQVVPMQLYPAYHDTGPKLVLGGVTIPAGQTGAQDLDAALDNIFAHSNVGPFISHALIQRLVTSNPTPEYVSRVAQRFNDNGRGVRGDLAAVVKAILLDDEARGPATMSTGKIKEPLLRLTQLWRAYNGRAPDGGFRAFANPGGLLGQGPLQANSVFNFFSPDFAPAGEIRDLGLVAPELEIATEYQNTQVTNTFRTYTFGRNSRTPGLPADAIVINIDVEAAVAADANALVNLVIDKLLAGQASATLRAEMLNLVGRYAATDAPNRASQAIYSVVTSPEYALQP
ncbi:MAG TPA: DUF1800 domain-containing protein [Gammaproteobacteria bacterium]|nr:DUF1800 domain-containing protein [Gammaproteobacteria bacterium]